MRSPAASAPPRSKVVPAAAVMALSPTANVKSLLPLDTCRVPLSTSNVPPTELEKMTLLLFAPRSVVPVPPVLVILPLLFSPSRPPWTSPASVVKLMTPVVSLVNVPPPPSARLPWPVTLIVPVLSSVVPRWSTSPT